MNDLIAGREATDPPFRTPLISPTRSTVKAREGDSFSHTYGILSTASQTIRAQEWTHPTIVQNSERELLLEELDDHPELAMILVIVLSRSVDAKDLVQSYDLDVNAYVQKPVDPDEFIDVIRSIENFWLEIIWLPAEMKDEEYLENSKQPK